ncbi:4'-phosphopantetheinyl transferase family protein [Zhongshania aliphaticivorans]|uniref:4'-phosphopantetheinyl transferase family protein n=1 Tax=Zhongshania aliphaticivorans TaxID=1470434 RepID=UPI0012E45CD5|nr:4'-phosphopantetheinyl transferase superfamily protein [Zhongshania aliphaticivorans]CAA0119131.1 4'-phosphopantetheinyl transferase Sfp [Zhongshania aliphaticivorans]
MISAVEKRQSVAGHVDVWYCFTDDHRLNSRLDQYETMLSSAELQQYQQLMHGSNGRDYLISRALLRTVLSEYCGFSPEKISFCVNAYGKPELINDEGQGQIQFNTAHTSGLTVCVVTRDNDVGVDVESRAENRGVLNMADDYFSALELQALNARADDQQLDYFYRYWTLKEAYIKARGEGLSIPLHDFSVVLDDEGVFSGFVGPEADRWDFSILCKNPNYTAALAMGGKINSIAYFHSVPLGQEVELSAEDAFNHFPNNVSGQRNRMIG